MKNNVFRALFILAAVGIAGCATSDNQRVDSLEARVASLERKVSTSASQEAETDKTSSATIESATEEPKQEVVIPETPTKEEIQAALKKAGYYDGAVDGRVGPQTKMAIEAFQTAHELTVDGKVGPNTWEVLKEYYTPVEIETRTTE